MAKRKKAKVSRVVGKPNKSILSNATISKRVQDFVNKIQWEEDARLRKADPRKYEQWPRGALVPGAQKAAAKRIRIAQPTLSNLAKGKSGVGISVLLKLRAATGQSIDAILGLQVPIPETELRALIDEIAGSSVRQIIDGVTGKTDAIHAMLHRLLQECDKHRSSDGAR